MAYKAIIFDLGGVLVDWNPNYVYDEQYFKTPEQRKQFFDTICTSDWNEEQDAGRSIVEATQNLIQEHPEWEQPIRDYYGRWTEMLKAPIPGTVEVFREMKKKGGHQFYALTNWHHVLFDIALVRYDFLHWFDGRVVSGEEKMRKPFPEFYQLLLDRYDLKADEVLFIDDNHRNVLAARELGIETIEFQSPEQLRGELVKRSLL